MYAPIHCHTSFSLLDGAIRIKDLVAFAKKHNLPAVSVTDHGTMAGIVEAYTECKKENVKLIPGIELYCAPNSRFDRKSGNDEGIDKGNYHLTAVAINNIGYRNLCKLSTLAYQEGFYYKPRVDKELLEQFNEGIIVTSGCLASEVNRKLQVGKLDGVNDTIEWFSKVFDGRYYIEIQENGLIEQQDANNALIEIAKKKGLPLLACLDCHFHDKEDHEAHEILLAVQTGAKLSDEKRFRFNTDEVFLRTPDEMNVAFWEHPEAVANTLDIANRCDFDMELGKYKFPKFPVQDSVQVLRDNARNGLRKKLDIYTIEGNNVDEKIYLDRLEYELDLIITKGFADYFLIVADLLDWAREQDIPVGTGRGSVAGSCVSWCLGITELDPIEHRLIFERFINPGRSSAPDCDLDISDERRGEVVQYLKDKYGEDKVAQVATYGTLKGKSCIRDIGRVLEMSFTETDKLSKLYPAAKHGKEYDIEEALELEPKLKAAFEETESSRKLLKIALKLEGLYRHSSKHAAGLVISPVSLFEEIPLMYTKGECITQYQFNDLDKIGLLKFDLLGLKTVTFIDNVVKLVENHKNTKIDWNLIGLNDKKTYELLSSGQTAGCFQVATDGMQQLLMQLKPDTFNDISSVLALFRPGPLESGMMSSFVKRKNGQEEIQYVHPSVKPILEDTYGTLVYQEQIMEIAKILGGYTLEEADTLRAILGKKKVSEMPAQESKFVNGCIQNGISESVARELFEQIKEFAAYSFNRAHSASYALITYRTAYLKAHYPQEFMTALLNMEAGDADLTFKNISECKALGINVLPPDVNDSLELFTLTNDGIRFGLCGIKGIGRGAHEILKNRSKPLESFVELLEILGTQCNKRVIDALVKCGALDSFGNTRRSLFLSSEAMLKNFRLKKFDKMVLRDETEWEMSEKLKHEREVLGFYISGHPLDTVKARGLTKISDVPSMEGKYVEVGGVVHGLTLKNTKKGKRYATFLIEDRDGQIACIMWPDKYLANKKYLEQEIPFMFYGYNKVQDEKSTFIVEKMEPLASTETISRKMIITMTKDLHMKPDKLLKMKNFIEANPGFTPIEAVMKRDGVEVRVELSGECLVEGTDEVALKLEKIIGKGTVSLQNI